MRRCVCAVAALLLAARPVHAAPRTLAPVDQCSADAGFAVFRQALGRAVARRDAPALKRLLAPDVLVNFGGDIGWAAFSRQWALDRPGKSGVWKELERILPLGCARVDKARVLPSLAGQFSADDDQDAFETMVVVERGAALRAREQADSRIVAKLNWDLVTALEAPDGGKHIKVRTGDGREGWLARRALRSPLDYRAVVEKQRGRWRITAFVAGD